MVPLYFGAPARPLFGVYHPSRATGDRGAGVVMVSPFGHEELHAHRAERHLAERLARAGFPTLRFDHDATGDSAGDDREGGRVAAWKASITLAVTALREQSGAPRVVLVGLRAGALLALATATEVSADRLVLWHPIANGRAHTRELLRLHKMLFPKRDLRQSLPRDVRQPPSRPGDAPGEDEEALGFVLRKETAADLAKIDPLTLAERPATGCLVVGGNDTPTEDKLIDKLKSLGVEVDYQHLPGHPFLVTDPHKSAVPDEVLTAIVDHLSGKYPVEGQATRASLPPRGGASITRGPGSEQAWLTAGPRPRFGVLSLPEGLSPGDGAAAGSKPAILLMNAGSIHHVGPNRAFVRMARRWASLGYPVLRMDLSGIGESPTAEGCVENVPYPRDAILDAQAAMNALEEHGVARRFILSGLCSGADIAFRTGVLDPRVVGAWMINPQAFYFESSDALKAFMDAELQAAYYQSAVWDTERWKRVFRGEVDLVRIAGVMRAKVESAIKRRAARVLGVSVEPAKTPEAKDVIRDLRSMASRGTDTLLLCSEDDPGLLYLLKYFGRELDGLDGLPGYRKEVVKGIDHTFTPLWSQDLLSDMLTEHLLQKHRS